MRARLILAGLGLAVIATVVVFVVSRDGDDQRREATSVPGLETRIVTAGEVDVEIQPRQLDDRGAVFAISFDTHSVELAMDVASGPQLEVDGTTWRVAEWDGDGPGGHHREGELRFDPAGSATGTARLVIPGLPEAVDASWQLEEGPAE